VRTVGGSSPAALLTPDLAFPSGHAKVSIEYRTDADAGTVPVRFRPLHPKPAKGWDAGQLPATAGQWQTRELDVDLKGAAGGRFEFLAGAEPQAGLWVRGFTARDPVPAKGKVLYHLDLSKQKPFVQRTVRFQEPGSKVPLKPVLETGPGKMPAGWYRWIEFPDGVAEFFADGPPGAMAFGLRMVSGSGGAQVNSPEFQAKTSHCRVRLLYQTGPTSPGFILRFRPTKPRGGAIWDAATLPPTGGSWRLAVIDLDLKGATGGLFEVFDHGSGADAALRIRELLIKDM
jgi:hypothetical protein